MTGNANEREKKETGNSSTTKYLHRLPICIQTYPRINRNDSGSKEIALQCSGRTQTRLVTKYLGSNPSPIKVKIAFGCSKTELC